uniref:Uncharacterized protein n=1 Tax=Romanomermis culicivorax TaxID=13658 RepID=A0A915J7H1_ROMCU
MVKDLPANVEIFLSRSRLLTDEEFVRPDIRNNLAFSLQYETSFGENCCGKVLISLRRQFFLIDAVKTGPAVHWNIGADDNVSRYYDITSQSDQCTTSIRDEV